MSFWTSKRDGLLDAITDHISDRPVYEDTFDAIASLRNVHEEHPGRVSRHDGWMRVASIQAPLLDVAKILDPEFLKDKRKFYRWLDNNKQFATYDRRTGRRT